MIDFRVGRLIWKKTYDDFILKMHFAYFKQMRLFVCPFFFNLYKKQIHWFSFNIALL